MKQRSNRQVSWVFVFLVVLVVPASAIAESSMTVFAEGVGTSAGEQAVELDLSMGETRQNFCECEGGIQSFTALSLKSILASRVPSRFKVHLYRAKGYDPYLYLGNYPYKGFV